MRKTASQVIEAMEINKENLEFLPTGFRLIDEELDGGFLRKELVVLGGKTGIGKSIVAGQIMWNLSQKGFNTAYFSLEIASEMVVARLLGSLSKIKPTRIMAGLLTVEEFQRKIQAKADFLVRDKFMYFYDDVYLLDQIIAEIKTNQYEFVVVDFIQNIFVPGSGDEYSRLSLVALKLQKLAKEANCCILVLSQLSNTVAREGQKNPNVEYKGSGSIATVCDLGFFIERREGVDQTQNPITINLRKNRRGRSGIAWEYTYHSPGGEIV